MAVVSSLAPQVQARVEESGAGIFWNLQTEVYTAILEAISDLLLLVGRPTQVVNQIVTLLPNQVWQPMPSGIFCITDINGPGSQVWKYSVFDFDFTQISWSSGWENDVGSTVLHWAAVGFNMFMIHPALTSATQVTVTGIAPATTETWPYSGNETVPFQDDVFSALEKYAAHYLRFKDGTGEFQASMELYQEYLAQAQRLTEISDRRDSYIWSKNLGVQVGVNPVTQR